MRCSCLQACQEDLDIDDQHDEQWGQDAAKKVEVHHVAHGHHVSEETPDEAAGHVRGSIPRLRAVDGTFSAVPPQEWCQANAKARPQRAAMTPLARAPVTRLLYLFKRTWSVTENSEHPTMSAFCART